MKRLCMFFFFLPLAIQAQQVDPIPFYGIQTHFGQGRSDLDSLLNLVRDAGIGSIRDEVYWHEIETIRDTFKFKPEHDAYIKGAIDRGIKPLIILDYGNDLYGGTPRDSASREAFGRYCKAVVGRYAPLGVKHYEVWNEPNLCIPSFCTWSPGPNPSEYVELLKVAYRSCKSVDSTVYIVGCSTSPLDEPETSEKIPGAVFISRVFQLGGGKYMDAVSFHQYPIGRTPEQWVNYECGRISPSAGSKPMWITEIGYPTSITSEEDQANFIARTYLLGRSVPQLERISWYDLQDDCGDGTNPECRYGILREDRSPKPAYLALKTIATLIGSKPLVSMTTFNNEYVLRFGNPPNQITAIWHSTTGSTKSLNVGSKYFSVIDRAGKWEHFIASDSTAVMTLMQKPQYIIPVGIAPKMKSLKLKPKEIVIDSTQSIQIHVSGSDTAGTAVNISPDAVQWKFVGTGGAIDSAGVFRASKSGSGFIVASYQGLADTATISIVQAKELYGIEEFESIQRWNIIAFSNVDSTKTKFSTSNERASSGATSGKFEYSFKYKSTISLTAYRVDFQSNIALPGKPDSLMVDVYGNGQPLRLAFRFRDPDGDYFEKAAADQPLLWSGAWQPVKIYLKSIPEGFDYPFFLDRMTIYVAQNFAQNDSFYSGAIYLDNMRLRFNSTTLVEDTKLSPRECRLYQNFPNPFNPVTVISYQLAENSFVSVKVYDLLGREVTTLVNRELPAGDHSSELSADKLSSGVYFYRLQAGKFSDTKKLVVMK